MSEEQQQQSPNEISESSEVDVEALIRKAKAEIIGHTWRQRGPWLICISCTKKHAIRLGVNKVLVGIDEKGKPIVRTIAR